MNTSLNQQNSNKSYLDHCCDNFYYSYKLITGSTQVLDRNKTRCNDKFSKLPKVVCMQHRLSQGIRP